MLRLKFQSSNTSFKDLNNPFYLVILDVNLEYEVIEETETDYYFASSPRSKHKVSKTDPNITVLNSPVPRLMYVLFIDGKEVLGAYYSSIAMIPYEAHRTLGNHEYKLMWKLV